MPLTFPSHQAAALPLKLWRPRWFDGVMLCTGAAAPDVAYAFDGFTPALHSHTLPAPLWWNLPVAVALAMLLRRAAPVVAAHLPGWWRDFGVLGRVRHPWLVSAASAILGAASHLGWDDLTHTDRWLTVVFGLRWTAPPSWYRSPTCHPPRSERSSWPAAFGT